MIAGISSLDDGLYMLGLDLLVAGGESLEEGGVGDGADGAQGATGCLVDEVEGVLVNTAVWAPQEAMRVST